MPTTTAQLTPTTDTTPAVAEVDVQLEPSGPVWVSRFPASTSIDDCADPFKSGLQSFVDALNAAGADVKIANTYRPPERAYMMHWAYMIERMNFDPRHVPAMDGVHIQWAHVDDSGAYTESASKQGARAMFNGFGLQGLHTPPALVSRHTARAAVDMNITWTGTLKIDDATGAHVEITSEPRNGMNADLKVVGATYGVIKFVGGATDKPHWSDTGH